MNIISANYILTIRLGFVGLKEDLNEIGFKSNFPVQFKLYLWFNANLGLIKIFNLKGLMPSDALYCIFISFNEL